MYKHSLEGHGVLAYDSPICGGFAPSPMWHWQRPVPVTCGNCIYSAVSP